MAFRLNEVETDNTTFYLNQINNCLVDIERSFPNAPFLQTSADFTLSAGVRVYPSLLPSNFSKMNDLTYPGGNIKLGYVTPEQFDIIRPSATEGGNPTIYTLRGYVSGTGQNFMALDVYPVPGSAINLQADFQISIPTVSAESAVPIIPAKYFELPVLYGEYRGLRRRGRTDDAQIAKAEYDALKQNMINEMQNRVTEMQRIKQVREFQKVNKVFSDPITNMYWGTGN